MSGAQRTRSRISVCLVSEVSVGYGTPQIIRVADSIAEHFNADVHIYEPDQAARPAVDIRDHVHQPTVYLQRIFTTSHPHSTAGRIEFCALVAKAVQRIAPSIILFGSSYGLPILLHLDPRRSLNILYCLEHVAKQPEASLRLLAKHCSIIIFPEINRARIYLERLGGPRPGQDTLVMYNANSRREVVPAERRVHRFFYGGTFHKQLTFGDYFLDPSMAQRPIDVYGIIDGYSDCSDTMARMSGKDGCVKYCGYVEANAHFFSILSRYQFSIVTWNPLNTAQHYAAPNKLFDAIACGVPVICAPHPQCVDIVKRWRCGMIADDWSLQALAARVGQGVEMMGSRTHAEMVRNCAAAMDGGLNWSSQFAKLAPVIDKHLVIARR